MEGKPRLQTTKASLREAVEGERAARRLNEAASKASEATAHALTLMKLRFTRSHDVGQSAPKAERSRVVAVAKAVCERSQRRGGRPKEETTELAESLGRAASTAA